MSVLLAVVQATVSASPSVAPVVQATTAAAATHAAAGPALPSLSDALNGLAALLSPYVVLIGATVAVAVQGFVNKIPWLQHDIAKVQDLRRKLVAVVLPLVGAYVASFATGNNDMNLAPWVFLVGQVLFAAFKALKASGAASASVALATEEPVQG